ncbi:MAG: YfiR family protein [Fulvivirga sp.]|nr:YfiR family protein [Fulvivirga sp.]
MKKLLFCVMLLVSVTILPAQNYQLHAVYIYQFTKYIKWPDAQMEGDFVIGVLGETPALEHLQKMADVKKAGNRDIVIRKFGDVSEVEPTHILFVGKEVIDSVSSVLKHIGGKHTLLITEEEGFGLAGSNINFVERDGRLVFELNRDAMRREGLKVSNELAKLAIVI